MADRLRGKVAIVTGAGSRGPGLGNGKATAILFAREGARVLCVDHMKERAEETVAFITGEGGAAEPFAADVTRTADCDAMVAAAVARWGGLDILHNNVGIESRHTLLDTTEQEWDTVMAVDAKSMAMKRSPLPRKTVAKNRSSRSPIRSRMTPMNHRKAMPAKGSRLRARTTAFRLERVVSQSPASAGLPGTLWRPLLLVLRRVASMRAGKQSEGWRLL